MDNNQDSEPMPINNNWKKNIALFMIGQGLSLLGSMLVHYAITWRIILETDSGTMLTFLAMAGSLPMVLISPFGGAWADRYNKKYLICIADAAIALVTLVMATLFSFGIEMIGLLLICMVIRAFGQGVQMPAVTALIPEIVPPEHLTRINALNGSVQSLVLFASPMAGAMVLDMAPIQAILYIDVVTACLAIGIVLFLVQSPQGRQKSAGASAAQYFREIGEGLRYIGRHTFIIKYIVIYALFAIFVSPAAMMTPLQVKRDWGEVIWKVWTFSIGQIQRLALIELVFFSGMMLGGVIMGAWGGFKNRSHSMALATAMFGLGSIGLGLLTNFWLYFACMGLIGLFMNIFSPPMMATLQINVEGAYMGRVFSVLMMTNNLMMPLGMVVWGPLANKVAIDWILIGTGFCVFLLSLPFVLDKTLLRVGAAMKE